MKIAIVNGSPRKGNTVTAINAFVKINKQFLTYRYLEDMAYMTYVRSYVTDNILPSLNLNYFKNNKNKYIYFFNRYKFNYVIIKNNKTKEKLFDEIDKIMNEYIKK